MKKIDVSLPVSILREGNVFIAYSPALDISTSADTLKKVRERFNELVGIFFEETIKRGTMEDALNDLGWKKTNLGWNPPRVISQESTIFRVPIHA